jgi:hypothetical protein
MTKSKILVIGFLSAGILCMAFVYGFHALRSYYYPYGFSHCCLKILGLDLSNYADAHNGRFPAGEKCPEASLSLLYKQNGNDSDYAEILRGKTVPLETVKNILERGELLGPDTCGWHYVEGLTRSDDSRLALVWDKIGLGHNGQRLPEGGHSVLFIQGNEEVIPGPEWPQFLKQQEELMAARTENAIKGMPALTAKIRLPSGEIVDHYDGSFVLRAFNSTVSGNGLMKSNLIWNTVGASEGKHEISLEINQWHAEPIEVEIKDGKATPQEIIFELK